MKSVSASSAIPFRRLRACQESEGSAGCPHCAMLFAATAGRPSWMAASTPALLCPMTGMP